MRFMGEKAASKLPDRLIMSDLREWRRIPLLYRVSLKATMTVYKALKAVWNPEINNKFDACIDQYNERDRYAMKIKIGDETHESCGQRLYIILNCRNLLHVAEIRI